MNFVTTLGKVVIFMAHFRLHHSGFPVSYKYPLPALSLGRREDEKSL